MGTDMGMDSSGSMPSMGGDSADHVMPMDTTRR